jgi:hypothetical protein
MQTFIVDVAFSTHDRLQQGIICDGISRVHVLADDGNDAQLIAAQIVAAARGVMPTATTVCI